MKKQFSTSILILLLTFVCSFAYGQKYQGDNPSNRYQSKVKTYKTGGEPLSGEVRTSAFDGLADQAAGLRDVDKETWIGESYYDLQTNSVGMRRIYANPDGTAGSVWTFHPNTTNTGFPNRGTGYANRNGSSWTGYPAARIESDTRTGWPSIDITTSGREVIVAHEFLATVDPLLFLYRDPGATNWTESVVPTDLTQGVFWARIAAGGNSVHVIAVSNPSNNQGSPYMGQDPALLYFRSSDGGETWDIKDYIIPGINSEVLNSVDVDAYVIDADANGNVAIAIFSNWNDVLYCKSTQNGEMGSWEVRVVNDFPLDNYVVNSLYTLEDIGGADPNGPAGTFTDPSVQDSFAVFTCDGAGAMTLDANGKGHLVFPHMYLSDIDASDAGWIFYPAWSGMSYWNEDMPDDGHVSIPAIEEAYDEDGNGIIELEGSLPNYGLSATSMPGIVVSEDGYIVVAYANVMESYARLDLSQTDTLQHYRHIYLTASNNGVDWETPYDMINTDVLLFTALLDKTEAVFPHLAYEGGTIAHLTYQFDDEPGLNVQGDEDPINSNTQSAWKFDILELFPDLINVDVQNVTPATFDFRIFPNPTHEKAQVSFSKVNENAILQVTNPLGAVIFEQQIPANEEGDSLLELNLEGFPTGMYYVKLQIGKQQTFRKLVLAR